MFSRIHQKLGTAGLVVAIVALLVALTGAAYAAGGLTKSQEKRVTAIAKKYAGKKGAKGAAGPQGTAGPQGQQGAQGSPGPAGKDGTDGISVTTKAFSGAKGACPEGGLEVETASPTILVCNGKKGTEGSPWTAGGVLPPGETETGGWAFGSTSTNANVALSFNIPLEQGLGAAEVHYLNATGEEVHLNETTFEPEEGPSTECLGSAAEPTSEPGNLCVYTGFSSGGLIASEFILSLENAGGPFAATGTSKSGARIFVSLSSAATGYGTWAVTAPEA
jgi:hypothetical protein